MNLEGLLSVSGKPGLYRMITNRKSGLVIEGLDGSNRHFAPARQHQFTPLESIAIFTEDGDAVPLRDVLGKMREQVDDNPPPNPKADNEELREYMRDVLPTHDEDRVYPSDIKKLVKWYGMLDEAGLIDAEPTSAAESPKEKAPDEEE